VNRTLQHHDEKMPMESSNHILVVDDHKDIRDLLAKFLVKHGMRVTTAADAAEARRHLKAGSFDLAVLDIMLPGEDGLSLCRSLTETGSIPVILLTAVAEDTDRIVGLELGADDYVPKPFNPRELLARIRAVLRRAQSIPAPKETAPGERLKFSKFIFDSDRRELIDDRNVVTPLSYGEYLLLSAFLHRPNLVLTRDQLLDITRRRAANLFDRSIDNQVSRLRRKIEDDPKDPKIIQTIWGGGYKFVGAVERVL
jgi:two-component system OmpR family response regulator